MGCGTTEEKRKKTGKIKRCMHGRQSINVRIVVGEGIYAHARANYHCKECRGNRICVHGMNKRTCKEYRDCGLLKTPRCTTKPPHKYPGYCWYCFANLFPDAPVVRKYMTTEKTTSTSILHE